MKMPLIIFCWIVTFLPIFCKEPAYQQVDISSKSIDLMSCKVTVRLFLENGSIVMDLESKDGHFTRTYRHLDDFCRCVEIIVENKAGNEWIRKDGFWVRKTKKDEYEIKATTFDAAENRTIDRETMRLNGDQSKSLQASLSSLIQIKEILEKNLEDTR